MERKEYLGRIKAYAIAKGTQDKKQLDAVKVIWNGRQGRFVCFPKAYMVSYNPDGTPIHTAILLDCASQKCQYDVLLDEVEEVEAENGG